MEPQKPIDRAILPFDARSRSRLLITLESGEKAALVVAKAAYHLGNRHVAVQVMPDRLRFLDDHVLAQMVAGLGLSVTRIVAPFEPEGGAYGHHHAHGSETPLARPKIHDFSAS